MWLCDSATALLSLHRCWKPRCCCRSRHRHCCLCLPRSMTLPGSSRSPALATWHIFEEYRRKVWLAGGRAWQPEQPDCSGRWICSRTRGMMHRWDYHSQSFHSHQSAACSSSEWAVPPLAASWTEENNIRCGTVTGSIYYFTLITVSRPVTKTYYVV